MAFAAVEDGKCEVEVTVFPRTLETAASTLVEDAVVGIVVSVGTRNGDTNLIAEDIFPLSEASKRSTLCMTLVLDADRVDPNALEELRDVLRRHPGPMPVLLELEGTGGDVIVSTEYAVAPRSELRTSLGTMSGVLRVCVTPGERR